MASKNLSKIVQGNYRGRLTIYPGNAFIHQHRNMVDLSDLCLQVGPNSIERQWP